jgi:hypothetical protein
MLTRLGLFFAFLPCALFAQVPYHKIESVATAPQPGQPLQLKVSGTWPNTCGPRFLPPSVEGGNIDLALQQTDSICGDALTPYSQIVDLSNIAPGFPMARDYRVRLWLRNVGVAQQLLAFRVIDVQASGTRSIDPEPGFWGADMAGEFQTSGTGIGFLLERQANSLAMTANTYQLSGGATWYLSAGPFIGSVYHGDLLRSVGGQPLWGTYRGPQGVDPAGLLTMEFLSDSEAILWFAKAFDEGILAPLDLMPISVRRLNFAYEPDGRGLAGAWSYTSSVFTSRVTPTVYEFVYVASRSTPASAVLADTARGAELLCNNDLARRDGPPRSCRLLINGSEVARFDNNSLNKLSGKGGPDNVALIRLAK